MSHYRDECDKMYPQKDIDRELQKLANGFGRIEFKIIEDILIIPRLSISVLKWYAEKNMYSLEFDRYFTCIDTVYEIWKVEFNYYVAVKL